MKKQCFAALLGLAIALLPVLNINAQDEKNEYLWYCWEETVKPEMIDQYLSLSKELMNLCREESFPFEIFTWSRKAMVFEMWYPIKNLNDMEAINEAWKKIIAKWGDEKYEAFNETIMHFNEKTCTVLGDLTYMPANPKYSGTERSYGRWIEIYLKPGKQKEFVEAVKWINEQRAAYDIEDYLMFASGGFGYQGPSFLVIFSHLSREEFNASLESHPDAYEEKFDMYLDRVFKLISKPVDIYHYNFVWDLSYQHE